MAENIEYLAVLPNPILQQTFTSNPADVIVGANGVPFVRRAINKNLRYYTMNIVCKSDAEAESVISFFDINFYNLITFSGVSGLDNKHLQVISEATIQRDSPSMITLTYQSVVYG